MGAKGVFQRPPRRMTFRKVLQVSVLDDQTLASDHRAERCQAIDGPRRGHRRDHTLLHHTSEGAGWPRCRRVLADDHDLDAEVHREIDDVVEAPASVCIVHHTIDVVDQQAARRRKTRVDFGDLCVQFIEGH